MSKKINKNDVKDNIIENEIKYKENDIVLDKYSIIKELGSGGTSTVYLAKKIVENLDDNVNDELVAVKIMQKRDGKDDYDWEKKKKEVEICCRADMLTKDNDYIIRTFDFLDEGDKITIVMEYIDGCSLKDIIEKEKGIPIDYAMYFFKKIVLGVNDLHNVFQHQIIHRDLKPENVLISSDFNTIKIIDFGISTIIVNDGEKQKILSDEKDLIGTYDYISPNALHFRQADKSGKEKINVNQFDIFSLGIILYEMLAGETPFNVEKAEDIELPAKYDVPCLSETIPDVPPCIDNIIFKCVAYQQKDQTFLYKNIQELLNDIIRYETNDDDVLNEKLIKPAINRIYHNKKIFNIEIEKSKIKFFETSWFFIIITIVCAIVIIVFLISLYLK